MRLCLIIAAFALAPSLAGAAPCRSSPAEAPTQGVRHYTRISGKPGQAGVFLLIYRDPAPVAQRTSSAGYCKLIRQPSSLPPPPAFRRHQG